MKLVSAIKPIINWISRSEKNTQLAPGQEITTSMWRDTGQVYYFLNTLKLSYESDYGLVSFENLNLDSLSSLLSELRDTQQPHLKQKVTAGQTFAFNISLCGVTWEESADSIRVKAIAEAAMLRAVNSDFVRSQAVFKHESFLEHNDILNAPSISNNGGIYTYSNISIEQFVEQLEHANSTISNNLKRRINVQPENFKQLFSEHEKTVLDNLLSPSENMKEKPKS
jgi:hypothetical protein